MAVALRYQRARLQAPQWLVVRPTLTALGLYVLLAVLFFLPGLLPGQTTSGADYLWSATPWTSSTPHGVPLLRAHPLLYGSNPTLIDPATVFEPFLRYTRSQLPHIPLWDPYIMAGMPYLADMQSAIFSPFSIPAYILPFWWSLSVIAVLKIVVASMGAFLLGRALRMRFGGAFLCGAIYGFGLFMVSWMPWTLGNVFPLIPWLLLATERLVRRPRTTTVAALSVIVALQFFGGHPESSFHALFATVAFFILRVLQVHGRHMAATIAASGARGARWRARLLDIRGPVVAFVAALVVGIALAAVVLLPFQQLLHQSSDLASRPRGKVTVEPRYFFSAFLPTYFPGVFSQVTGFYVAALTLPLAVIALFKPRVERICIAAFSAACILVVLGIQPFFGIVSRLPGFNSTYNTRLTILYLLGMALLAGWGLSDLMIDRPRGRRAAAMVGVAIAILVFPIVVAIAGGGISPRLFDRAFTVAWRIVRAPVVGHPDAISVLRFAGLIAWVVFAGIAVALIYARARRGLGANVFAVLAIVLVLGDLFRVGMGVNPAIPQSHAQMPTTPSIRYLQAQRPARFVGVTPNAGTAPLPPDLNLGYGLYDARGYDFPVDARFARLWTKYVAPPNPLLPIDTPTVPELNLLLVPQTLRILSLLGVRNFLAQNGQKPLNLPGLHVVYHRSDATIYDNDNALPRVWMVTSQHVVDGDGQALATIGQSSFDPSKMVITEHRLSNIGQGTSAASGAGSTGTARIVHYGTQQVAIQASATRRSELVLSDTWFPGWQVTVDGRSAPIDRVDYLLRGVPLSPGSHRIVFSYNPSSFRTGWLVSVVATFMVAAALVVAWTRRRRVNGHQGAETGESADHLADPSGRALVPPPVAVSTRSPPGE